MQTRPSSFAAVLEDIRRRLRPALAYMPDGEFSDLTVRIAEIEMKYRTHEAFLSGSAPQHPASDEGDRLASEP